MKRNKAGQFIKGSKPINGFKKGHKHTEKWKKEQSQRMKGRKPKNFEYFQSRRHNFPKGHKMNLGRKRPDITGEKCHLWKGGVTSLKEKIRRISRYKEWRRQIYGRDNYMCRACGKRGVYLEAHHYPKSFKDIMLENKIKTVEQAEKCFELWNLDNGITLCRECHKLRAKVSLWFFNNIHSTAKIGENTKIGSYCEIGKNVVIGKNCSIQAFVFMPCGVKLEDNVFVGPGTVFTNDKHPPSHGKSWMKTVVKAGASIGAHCTILPGVIIGERALVGAGAVVTKDIPADEIWIGNPAAYYKTI